MASRTGLETMADTDAEAEQPSDTSQEGERETWTRPIDFVFACVGFSAGLTNVWRFPYICARNGGGAFLIPYCFCAFIGGIPLFYLEVAVGQFMQQGGIGAWRICPIFQGIGVAKTIFGFFVNCYYNVILSWAFYYFFSSFTSELPWSTCNNSWNTEQCFDQSTEILYNANSTTTLKIIDAATEFWENKVLGINQAGGIEDVGPVKWDLALILLLAWIVVYACICNGIKSSGKVMYVTVTSSYILMTILLIRGATLPGSLDGVIYYVKPDFGRLLHIQVWADAGIQIFYSYAISFGALTALGSFNKFHHNSYRDTVIFACINTGTSIFAGFVVFCTLGYMASQLNVSVAEVATQGTGLVFIAFAAALARMPVAPLWSVFFFLMIMLLGLNTQFVGVQGFITAITDIVPWLRQGRWRKPTFIGCCCLIKFFIGLSMVTNGGMFVLQLFDHYAAGNNIVFLIAFFECIAITWLYGINRFDGNLQMMYGFRINPYMLISWTVTTPLFCIALFVMSIINHRELTYGYYVYPPWAIKFGWLLAGLSAIWIQIVMGYKIFKYSSSSQGLKGLIQPEDLKDYQLLPKETRYTENNFNLTTYSLDGNAAANGESMPPYYDSVYVEGKQEEARL